MLNSESQATPPKLIRAGCLIDGRSHTLHYDQAIRVQGGMITTVEDWPAGEPAPDVDLSLYMVVPGLIDTHLHVTFDPAAPQMYDPVQNGEQILRRSLENARALLCAGVTTAADCGAQDELVFAVQQACQANPARGPRILTSGYALVPQGGHGAELIGRPASGVEALRRAVLERAAAGADFIKVMATAGGGEAPGQSHYDLAELTVIHQTAADCGLRVAAHAHGVQGIRDCVQAGIERIEHCTFYAPDGSFAFDPALAARIARQGVFVTPTNAIDYRRIARGGEGAPRQELNRIWRGLLQAGVTFAAGSDACVTDMHYDDYALIPELMISELGMTPWQALLACTAHAAAALGLEGQCGVLEAGKQADLVALAGNPLEDICALRRVSGVVRQGRLVYQAAASPIEENHL
ncbi:MAG: amidohydrolase family protein [Chloroflexota bacterium]